MKATIKKYIPTFVWGTLRTSYESINRLPELPAAYLHPWRRESIARLNALKDVHKGKRAFIIGNGPSLNNTDLSKLKNEFTFGLNRIYLMFENLGFATSFLVCINDLVIEQCASEMSALEMPKFFAWRSRHHFANLQFSNPSITNDQLPSFIYTTYNSPKFSRTVSGRVWEGATVTYVALQLAYHMGFDEVILIGVDHNFTTKGEANKTITSQGDDPNHFAPNYFGKGFKWQLPDLEISEIGYRMARKAYEANGRKVIDATVGGKLTVFEKADYNKLF
jgi:hypothetical protein